MQRARVDVANHAGAVASGAGNVRALVQGRPQALPRQFHETEARDLAHLYTCAVVVKRVAQAILDIALGTTGLHVNEVDNDEATEVAQTKLPTDFIGRLEVGAQCGLFNI